MEGLLDLCSDIENLIDNHFPEEIEERLRGILKDISSLQERVSELPESIDELEIVKKEIEGKTCYEKALLGVVEERSNKLIDLQNRWITTVLLPIEEDDAMDAQKCTSCIEKIHNAPDYISKDTIERARKAEKTVTKRLHECKVQGVLSLYNNLTEEEKDEFKKLILL